MARSIRMLEWILSSLVALRSFKTCRKAHTVSQRVIGTSLHQSSNWRGWVAWEKLILLIEAEVKKAFGSSALSSSFITTLSLRSNKGWRFTSIFFFTPYVFIEAFLTSFTPVIKLSSTWALAILFFFPAQLNNIYSPPETSASSSRAQFFFSSWVAEAALCSARLISPPCLTFSTVGQTALVPFRCHPIPPTKNL